MSHAALYLRLSQDRAGTQLGIERQRAECLARLGDGYTVTEYVDNDVSASSSKVRPAYQRLMADAKAGRVNTVVVWDLDRLTRKPREMEDWIDLGEAGSVNLLTVSESIDLRTTNGRMYVRIKASVARQEVEHKSDRQKSANAQRAATGKPMPGKRAFGYEPDNMTVRESEAERIRWAHQALTEGVSLHAIARTFNEAGVLTSQGSTWRVNQLRVMLSRPRNAGLLVVHGVVSATSLIEPVVSLEQHELALSILSAPDRLQGPGRKPSLSWLSGLMTCGVCGAPMRAKQVTAKGVRERFYMCESKVYRTEIVLGERHVAVTARVAEKHIEVELMGALKQRLDNPPTGLEADRAQLSALHAQRAQIAAERAQVTALALVPGVDMTVTQTALQALSERAERVESELTELATRNAELSIIDVLQPGEFYADKGINPHIWEQQTKFRERFRALDMDTKRALVDSLLRIEVNNGKGVKRIVTERTGA